MMAYFNKNEFQVSILLSFLTFATICVTLIIVNVNGHCALTKQNVRNDSSSSPKSTGYKVVSRLEWLAQPPGQESILSTPVPYVIILQTATENCSSQAQCVFQVRYIQTCHMESRGWNDIGYNFLIGGDGMVYQGRGWDKEGAHTYGYNAKSIGIAFIGDFIALLPSNDQLKACKVLIQDGISLGYIQNNYTLFGSTQSLMTDSYGNKLYQEIETWPHWKSKLRT